MNPTDVLLRSGAQAALVESPDGPWIPGMELSGTVERLGQDYAGPLAVGDNVIGIINSRRTDGGAQSGWICAPSSWFAKAPASVAAPEAATLAMNGVTAIMVLEHLLDEKASTVLVTGAAGALGAYVVQLAAAHDLTVIGLGRPGDAELIAQSGAAHVLSSDDSLLDRVHEVAPDGVDVVVDAALLMGEARSAARRGGLIVNVRPTEPVDDDRRSATVSVMQRIGDTDALRAVVSWAEQGVLRPKVNRVLPAGAAQEAYRLVERGGLRGRVVLDLTEDA
ncbi:zinc-binding dehydrogenase [Aeromicrobium sp. zg-636]|uniref:Zinc-binding dehydrogenase n=1 Tax=Aeromicrobium senzhongii TaxID=2663859 RepID=A0A8I0EWA0_9ACTN|nr:zinc-binding dehydrogenase [Aeromicrobium senzhongii]